MKKILFAILLSLLISISLVACKNVESDVKVDPAETQEESPLFVP